MLAARPVSRRLRTSSRRASDTAGVCQPMIRFGVLGAARVVPYGLLTPASEVEGVEVRAIASRSAEKAEEFAARHGIERSYASYEALVSAADIDAVYIALPPALHYE